MAAVRLANPELSRRVVAAPGLHQQVYLDQGNLVRLEEPDLQAVGERAFDERR
jgi:hypothetical protein